MRRRARPKASDAIARGTERVAFIGKPCDVASASEGDAADPALAAKVPLTIAIFCAGAPNLVATERLLDRLGVPKDASAHGPALPRARLAGTDAGGVDRPPTACDA
jgi:hypothetical protein